MLTKYSDFRPTPSDSCISLAGREDWYVAPVVVTRDSDALTRANWEVQSRFIPECDDCEIHTFGHWGPGWFQLMLVRPNTPAHAEALRLAKRLEDYACLDEDLFSELEQEAATDSYTGSDLVDDLQEGETLSERALDAIRGLSFGGAMLCVDAGALDYSIENDRFRWELRHNSRGDLAVILRVARSEGL